MAQDKGTITLTEEQAVGLVRNALLVAGEEMGDGDHWPVVNATIHAVMKDWENLKLERDVQAEMRKHIYDQLDQMDKVLASCSDDLKADTEPKLKELREIYDAYFETVKEGAAAGDEELPAHVKRAQEIIMTLEGDDDCSITGRV